MLDDRQQDILKKILIAMKYCVTDNLKGADNESIWKIIFYSAAQVCYNHANFLGTQSKLPEHDTNYFLDRLIECINSLRNGEQTDITPTAGITTDPAPDNTI